MDKAKDIVMRGFLFISGLFYFAAAYLGANVLMGTDQKSDGSNSKHVSQQLMQYEWGISCLSLLCGYPRLKEEKE